MKTSGIEAETRFFADICADPYKAAREAAKQGRKVAGYMCSYSPQELLHAAGYYPVRVLGRQGAAPRADALLQTFVCSFARSSFDAGLAGELDFLEVMLFAHTCDTMQNLADLWRSHCPRMKTIVTSMPNVLAGEAASAYFRKELERVRGCIEEAAGSIADEALLDSIRIYERHRAQIQRLYALRRRHPGVLSGTQMMAVMLSSCLVPRETHLHHVEALCQAFPQNTDASAPASPKVVVGGSVCQSLEFIAAIEDAGCWVVDDDLCMGSRSHGLPAIAESPPMDMLAQAYWARTPCPALYKPGFDPADPLIERVRASSAGGVIFLITKFCDPYAFDYAHVSGVLEKIGIPALMIEIEQHLPVPEQMRTRVEAFSEMLMAKGR